MRSTPRPRSAIRVGVTERSAPGPRSPLADTSTEGKSRATNSPCSPVVNGKACRANCANAPAWPGRSPPSSRSAPSTVRRSSSGARPWPLDHGTTIGRRSRSPARSPSTSTASTLSPRCRATSVAPAAPALPPLVEASTSVLRRVRPRNTRASSIRPAVPDSCAVAGRSRASRWATTTILRSEKPARVPTTVRSSWRPAAVRASKLRSRTRKPPRSSSLRTRVARPASPWLPGSRDGNSSASAVSVPKARAPENESGGSVVVSGACGSWSENAATTNASSAGSRAAR